VGQAPSPALREAEGVAPMHMQHAVLLVTFLTSPIHPQRSDDFKLSTNSELVLLDVGVTDRYGTPVSNLSKEDFKVFDNGKIQTITQFATDDVPVTVGLVIDNSGSMGAKRPEVVTAGLAFIKQSNPADEIFVTHFNDHVTQTPFATDFDMLRSALLTGQPGGRTALYDAIVTSLDQLATGTKDKRTLLLVSDGGDNASKHTFEDVISAVRKSRATIYTVGIFDEDDTDRNPVLLRRLASISGGVAFFPKQIDEIVDICKQIAKDIRERYTIGYVPVETDRTSVHKIKVAASQPDGQKLIVHTRTSYLIP